MARLYRDANTKTIRYLFRRAVENAFSNSSYLIMNIFWKNGKNLSLTRICIKKNCTFAALSPEVPEQSNLGVLFLCRISAKVEFLLSQYFTISTFAKIKVAKILQNRHTVIYFQNILKIF